MPTKKEEEYHPPIFLCPIECKQIITDNLWAQDGNGMVSNFRKQETCMASSLKVIGEAILLNG